MVLISLSATLDSQFNLKISQVFSHLNGSIRGSRTVLRAVGEHGFVLWRNLKAIPGLHELRGVLCLQDVISPLQGTDVSLASFYPGSGEFRKKSSHFLDVFNATRAAGDG